MSARSAAASRTRPTAPAAHPDREPQPGGRPGATIRPTPDAAGDPPRPGDGYVQSFARGLAVLRAFNAEAPSQTLTEVAARTGLTRAGARRILLTLQQLGYVRLEDRHFRLTPKVLDLGFAYLSSLPVWQLAQPVMENLVETVKESCSAAVLDGDEVVYVLRVPTHQIMSINLGVGSRLPAYCTSMGRVLLAGLDDDTLRLRLGQQPLPARTRCTETDPRRLLAVLAQVRQQGWALVVEELEEGLASLAAPIRDRSGRVVAAINVSGQPQRTPPARLLSDVLPHLLDAAARINALMRTNGR